MELGEYEAAAKCYYQYLRFAGQSDNRNIAVNYVEPMSTLYSYYSPIFKDFIEWPADYNEATSLGDFNNMPLWINSFLHAASPGDVISYIPMAVNYTMGKTTDIPASYGYNYYGTENSSAVQTGIRFSFDCPKTEDIQIVPSQAYCDSARCAQYYYYTNDRLNYLCQGYHRFFEHVAADMDFMKAQLDAGKAPSNIMKIKNNS